MDEKFKVVGIGEVLWDLLPGGKVLGGAPANFAFHAHQLGAEGYVVSSVGNDSPGREIIRRLNASGVNLMLGKVDYPTGTVKVTLNDLGVPEYEIIRDVAWDHIRFTPESAILAGDADAVCFGSLAQRSPDSRQAIAGLVKLVPEKALRIFDINLRQHYYSLELIEASLSLANILKINDEEVQVVAGLFGWETLGMEKSGLRLLKHFNLDVVALTCGTEGSWLFTRENRSFMETPVVDVADTVGAGDSFTAALAMGLLNRRTLAECHALAVGLSAFVCTQPGAMPVHPGYFRDHL
jgi:fructokinase